MSEKKYRLIKHKGVNIEFEGFQFKNIFRLEALRDIPLHGVKTGDLGGWVSSRFTLSQKEDCWVGDEAYVLGNAKISGNSYVGGKAKVLSWLTDGRIYIREDVRIDGNAKVSASCKNKNLPQLSMKLFGAIHITDDAEVRNLSQGSGNAKIGGNARVNGSKEISDSAQIYGNAILHRESQILGCSRIFDNAVINKNATVRDVVINKDKEVGSYDIVSNFSMQNDEIASIKNTPNTASYNSQDIVVNKANDIEVPTTLEVFKEIKANIEVYETDIVKIIKHPVMTDRSDPHTLQMVMALNKATRLSRNPSSSAFEEAVISLEEKFLTAESNALKIAATLLSDEDRKKAEKAKDLLRIAANEGSSEQEKKASFKQAFKQLEGVITVPEAAVDTFRIKIGLQELESL